MKSILFVLSAAMIIAPVSAAPGGKKPVPPQKAFKKKDTNHDGTLSKLEFVHGAKDTAKIDKAFKRKDKNDDGKLTLEEFKATAKKKKP